MLYRSLKPLSGICLSVVLLSGVFVSSSAAQDQQNPIVRNEMRHDVSRPLSELIKNAPAPAGGQPEADEMLVIPHPSGFKPADEPDPVLQPPPSAAGAPVGPPISVGPTLINNFD